MRRLGGSPLIAVTFVTPGTARKRSCDWLKKADWRAIGIRLRRHDQHHCQRHLGNHERTDPPQLCTPSGGIGSHERVAGRVSCCGSERRGCLLHMRREYLVQPLGICAWRKAAGELTFRALQPSDRTAVDRAGGAESKVFLPCGPTWPILRSLECPMRHVRPGPLSRRIGKKGSAKTWRLLVSKVRTYRIRRDALAPTSRRKSRPKHS